MTKIKVSEVSLLKVDLQYFSVKKTEKNWFSIFQSEVRESSFSDIVEPIFTRLERIAEFPDDVTKEEIEELAKDIESAPIPEAYKESLSKKLKVYDNRLSRAFPEDFGAILKHYRTAAGLSLRDLEALTGVTASYIQRIEAGKKRAPGIVVINKLSKALNADLMDSIISGKNSSDEAISSIQELIVKNPFTVNDKKADFAQKEALIKVINIVLNNTFEERKTEDTLELLFAAMELRKTLE